jgi:hypothetical protein
MMDALTGDVADILRIRNTFPYMKILPDDRIMLNDNSRFLRNVAHFLLTNLILKSNAHCSTAKNLKKTLN